MKNKSILLLCALIIPVAAQAQAGVTLFGALSNFDVLNTTGQTAFGFEIEIQGITSIGGTFDYNRYGAPQVVPFIGGVYVRYMAPWDPARQMFVTGTPIAVDLTPTAGHQCVLGTFNYDASGCEHFGVWTMDNPTATVYRWMLADPNNPGQLISSGTPVAIPAPTWVVLAPALPAGAPEVAADVVAPIPARAFQFGDAQWMKVYKTENQRMVGLNELVADNAVVPQDAGSVESPWVLMQDKIGGLGKKNQHRNQGVLGNTSHAVVRRFEFFKFAGTYDPLTHEAVCLDGRCDTADPTEVGDFIGAQNAGANLNVPVAITLTLTTTGNGQVTGVPGTAKCSGACSSTVADGTLITLTANPASGTIFAGWSGPCTGTQTVCAVTMNSSANVTASFLQAFTLAIGRSGKGTISSTPSGIGCGLKGGSCSTKFGQGTTLTLTATPDPGSVWTGWGGACTGNSLSCVVTIAKDTSVQANFR